MLVEEGIVQIDLGVRWLRSYLVVWPYGKGYSWQCMEGGRSEKDPLSIGRGGVWEVIRGGVKKGEERLKRTGRVG